MVIYGARRLTCRGQARDLLALAAAEHWGLSPLPELARTREGKPFFPGREDLHFNLSHSGDLALCALDSGPVGADIQVVQRRRPSLPRRVCSGEELAWLEAQPDLWPAFTLLWALKESRIKQRGQGVAALLAPVPVPLPGPEPVRQAELWFRSYAGPGWAAAVCGLSCPPAEIRWRVLP